MPDVLREAGTKAVEIENLSLRYAGAEQPLLSGFNMTVEEGQTCALFGDSGCGKSTILRCLCALVPRYIKAEVSGTLLLFGKPPEDYSRSERAQTLGVVFQNPETQLFCDSVEDEIAFGLENLCLDRDEISHRIDEALQLTGLGKYREVSPAHLSGGQKQLAVFAAVTAMQPRLLLLDEAMSQLDEEGTSELKKAVLRCRDRGQTIILVDHKMQNIDYADQIILLQKTETKTEAPAEKPDAKTRTEAETKAGQDRGNG